MKDEKYLIGNREKDIDTGKFRIMRIGNANNLKYFQYF